MAIWQFDLFFVPRSSPLPVRTADGYDLPTLSEPATLQAYERLVQHMGQQRVVLDGWLMFGPENGSRMDLMYDESGGAELSVRVDAQCDSQAFCQFVCELARNLDCGLLIAETGQSLEPDSSAVAHALLNSRAVKYVNDPYGFLKSIKTDG